MSLSTSNIDKDEVPKFPNYATIRQQFEKPNENGQQLANPTTVNIQCISMNDIFHIDSNSLFDISNNDYLFYSLIDSIH